MVRLVEFVCIPCNSKAEIAPMMVGIEEGTLKVVVKYYCVVCGQVSIVRFSAEDVCPKESVPYTVTGDPKYLN